MHALSRKINGIKMAMNLMFQFGFFIFFQERFNQFCPSITN